MIPINVIIGSIGAVLMILAIILQIICGYRNYAWVIFLVIGEILATFCWVPLLLHYCTV